MEIEVHTSWSFTPPRKQASNFFAEKNKPANPYSIYLGGGMFPCPQTELHVLLITFPVVHPN